MCARSSQSLSSALPRASSPPSSGERAQAASPLVAASALIRRGEWPVNELNTAPALDRPARVAWPLDHLGQSISVDLNLQLGFPLAESSPCSEIRPFLRLLPKSWLRSLPCAWLRLHVYTGPFRTRWSCLEMSHGSWCILSQ